MKNLLLILSVFALFSCKKEDEECKTCNAITESNELLRCGYANNGWETLSSQSLGEFCGGTLTVLNSQYPQSQELTSPDCGATYTLRTKLECN